MSPFPPPPGVSSPPVPPAYTGGPPSMPTYPGGPPSMSTSVAAPMSVNSSSQEPAGGYTGGLYYTPVRHHWCYRQDQGGVEIWRPFSMLDSRNLEIAFSTRKIFVWYYFQKQFDFLLFFIITSSTKVMNK